METPNGDRSTEGAHRTSPAEPEWAVPSRPGSEPNPAGGWASPWPEAGEWTGPSRPAAPTGARDTPSDDPTRELDLTSWLPPPEPHPWQQAANGGRPPYGPWGYTGWAQPPPSSPFPPPSPPRRHTGLWLSLVAALVLLATASGLGIRQWSNSSSSPTTTPPTTTGTGGSRANAPVPPTSVIAAKATPALTDVDALLGYQRAEAAGTGIVLTGDGLVLTNNHVIEGATQIRVTDLGNHKVYTASVVGYDRTDDIAVLRMTGASGLQTAPIGNSSTVKVGQAIVGIGNAGGTDGPPTAVSGEVTALNEKVTASDESEGTTENLTGLIQTNANIQAGDSGGPLLNTSSQVVGVNTAGSTGFSFRSHGHQAFAIPVNQAQTIATKIEAGEASTTVHIGPTAFLGVQVSSQGGAGNSGAGNSGAGNSGAGNSGAGNSGTGNSGISGTSGTGASGTGNSGAPSGTGAPVAGVLPGTPAASTGVTQGDTITSVGGHHVGSPTDLSKILDGYHPGDVVSVAWVDSGGQSHAATVTLTDGPAA